MFNSSTLKFPSIIVIQYLLNDYFWPFCDCLKEWMEESTTPGPMRTYKGPPHNPSQSLSQSPRLLLSSFNFLNLNFKFLVFPNFWFSNSLYFLNYYFWFLFQKYLTISLFLVFSRLSKRLFIFDWLYWSVWSIRVLMFLSSIDTVLVKASQFTLSLCILIGCRSVISHTWVSMSADARTVSDLDLMFKSKLNEIGQWSENVNGISWILNWVTFSRPARFDIHKSFCDLLSAFWKVNFPSKTFCLNVKLFTT